MSSIRWGAQVRLQKEKRPGGELPGRRLETITMKPVDLERLRSVGHGILEGFHRIHFIPVK